jgi:hypothetical protein
MKHLTLAHARREEPPRNKVRRWEMVWHRSKVFARASESEVQPNPLLRESWAAFSGETGGKGCLFFMTYPRGKPPALAEALAPSEVGGNSGEGASFARR